MVTLQIKLSIEDIIASLPDLDNEERVKLQRALLELCNEEELEADVNEGLADIENGRSYTHDFVMKEIKAKYQVPDV